MKRYFNLSITLFIAASMLLVSCDKDDDDDETTNPATTDTEAPVLKIHSPAAGMFNSGDNVHIHVEITENDELHEYSIVITNDDDGTEYYRNEGHDHSTTLEVHDDFTTTVTGHTDMTLTATATDHEGNVGTETVHFHFMP